MEIALLVLKFYNAYYFEAGHRFWVRSLLDINEQPKIKPDAKRVVLEDFYGWVAAISL